MNKSVSQAIAVIGGLLLLGACADTGTQPEIRPELGKVTVSVAPTVIPAGGQVDLVAGQHTVVGHVEVTGTDPINVRFVMDEGWCLYETHVAIGDDLADLPQNKGGNPKVGHFPYGDDALNCVSDWDVDIPAPVVGSAPWAIGAHAVVQEVCEEPEDIQYLFGVLDGPNDVEGGLGDGDLYRINPATGNAELIYAFSTDPSTDMFSPNGLAYDDVNERLYFSVDPDGDRFTGGTDLYYFDVNVAAATPQLVTSAGAESVDEFPIYNASWYDGAYYFMPNYTDELWKITFGGGGTTIAASTQLCTDVVAPAGATSLYFGDIAISDAGVLYGWARNNDNGEYYFFQTGLDCTGASSTNVTTAHGTTFNLQLAFGEDGTLWGHQALSNDGVDAGRWYGVNMADGSLSPDFATGPSFTDISAGFVMEGEEPECAEPETAWGDGMTGAGFPGNSWATYFLYSAIAP